MKDAAQRITAEKNHTVAKAEAVLDVATGGLSLVEKHLRGLAPKLFL